jgi:hypothetical protein
MTATKTQRRDMKKHRFEIHRINWRGIDIEVTYERDWLNIEGYSPCHLTLKALVPGHSPLPLTETGYKSHFTDPSLVDAAGGPVAYVVTELDEAAKCPEWIAYEADSRQLTLF